MTHTCLQSQRWLQRTFQDLLKSLRRSVSTTSAIRRGLRATEASQERRNGRARSRGPSHFDHDRPNARSTRKAVDTKEKLEGHIRSTFSVSNFSQDQRKHTLSSRTDGVNGRHDGSPASRDRPTTEQITDSVQTLRRWVGNVQYQEGTNASGSISNIPKGLGMAHSAVSTLNRAVSSGMKDFVRSALMEFGGESRGEVVVGDNVNLKGKKTVINMKDNGRIELVLKSQDGTSDLKTFDDKDRASIDGAISTIDMDSAERFRILKFRIRKIQALETTSSLETSPALQQKIFQTRRLLKHINTALTNGSDDSSISSIDNLERSGLCVSGEYESMDKTRTRIWKNSDGFLRLVLKDQERTPFQKYESTTMANTHGSATSIGDLTSQRSGSGVTAYRPDPQGKGDAANSRGTRASPVTGERDDETPLPVPYTTAASTFLYGTNTVLAALRAKRRKLYQLYLSREIADRDSAVREILRLSADLNITRDAPTKLLAKMSTDRPHNGIVLETSKLPSPPVLSLGKPQPSNAIIPLSLERQSAEDIAINGAPVALATLATTWRHPLIVMLDGISDPGNLGAILRTCYFYGVDGVAIAKNTCANLDSAVLAKSSSGACEAVNILSLSKPSGFIYDSAKAGWRIYAAVAPLSSTASALQPANAKNKYITTSAISMASPLAKYPCILMLGSEGEGLRENLKARADYFVSIEAGQRSDEMPDVAVDSVNVSVAAGVLVESFLRRPVGSGNRGVGGLGF